MKILEVPIQPSDIDSLSVGESVVIKGDILAGRDAVLPRLCELIQRDEVEKLGITLEGGVVFHTAVSPAGIGPTSSNKVEIEGSFETLSQAGIRIHLGKGAISPDTVNMLAREHSCFAVIPPVTALLKDRTLDQRVAGFPELGMEALHVLESQGYPAIIAAVNGKSIFGETGE